MATATSVVAVVVAVVVVVGVVVGVVVRGLAVVAELAIVAGLDVVGGLDDVAALDVGPADGTVFDPPQAPVVAAASVSQMIARTVR